jgi:insertion element IS1 protein InsB
MATDKIVAWEFGKRDYNTAKKLRNKITQLGLTFSAIATDNWDSFSQVFKLDNQIIDKKYTLGIEGNNCRLRHRIRRAVRKTCCFSKIMFNHLKAFRLAFFYINFGHV